jgi:peroxiredoxin/mono/diheme cytochrome c family protein
MSPLGLPVLLVSLLAQTGSEAPGVRIGDFSLRDHRGQSHRLSDLSANQLVVVVFFSADCPLAKLYAPRLVELAEAYKTKGVAFLGIDANIHDKMADVGRYVQQHDIPFPVVKDVGNTVADRFAAARSPEVFVLDRNRVVRYRGRIDDQYGVGSHRPRSTRDDLAIALEELLAGKAVTQPITEAVGCPLSRPRRPAAEAPVTYCRDIAPLFQRHCQACHRPGQVASFSLTSFSESLAWSSAIREVVEDRRMPPWSANPAHGRFANDNSLKDSEREKVLAWIDGGCSEGDRAELPPPVRWPAEWSIGEPDLVISMAAPFTVPAQGAIEYQYFAVDPGFREDRWVQAAEILPGNKAVVHHCNVFLQPPGIGDPALLPDSVGSNESYCFTMMAPGTQPMVLPPGMAKRIPAGWRVVFVIHYTAIGSVQKDQTRLGLKFAEARQVRQEVATRLMCDLNLRIPPGAADHRVSQTWEVHRDVQLLSLFPHMHLRGKSFRYELIHADGSEEVLLDIPQFDFNWQHRYILAEPKLVRAGSRLRCTAVYDNSAGNPANPDPSATVKAGMQSWEEMFNGYFDVVLVDEDLIEDARWPVALWHQVRDLCRPKVTALVLLLGGFFMARRPLARWLGASKS